MAVTKLIKKAAKNKSRAKQRVKTIRQSLTRNLVASPYKEESGVIIGSVSDVLEGKVSAPAPAEEPMEAVEEYSPVAEVETIAEETSSEEISSEEESNEETSED